MLTSCLQKMCAIVIVTKFMLATLQVYAGRAGANANVMVAYTTFADDLEYGEADLRVCYWLMFHKPSPDMEGGCGYDDLTWKRRDKDYDDMTYEHAIAAAKDALDSDDGRQQADVDMLNAAGRIADHFDQNRSDTDSNVHDGVDLFVGDNSEDE
jgi:hypothetical protein